MRRLQPKWGQRYRYDGVGRLLEVLAVPYRNGQAQTPQWQERYGWGSDPTQLQPLRIERPSVVPGQVHSIELSYNDAGQITRVTERGFSPLDSTGQLARQPQSQASNATATATATALTRSTSYTWQRIAGLSLLTHIDGPLPNGPDASPQDSDITRIQWDGQGRFITAVTAPGGRTNTLAYDSAGRVQSVRNEVGQSTSFVLGPQHQLLQVTQFTQNQGDAKNNNSNPRSQSWRYNALGQATEGGSGALYEPDAGTSRSNNATDAYRPQWAQHLNIAGQSLWQASALGVLRQTAYDTEGRPIQAGVHSSTMQRQRTLVPVNPTDYTPITASTPTASTPTRSPTASLALRDDFGRIVYTRSPQHDGPTGHTWRQYDNANRLVAMQDASGHRATYQWDAQGRITRQEVLAANTATQDATQPTAQPTTEPTTWSYTSAAQGSRLSAVQSPGHAEHYAHDARGYVSQRSLTLGNTNLGNTLSARTRYQHDAQGQLTATSLPSGHWLHHSRNGQGQVVSMTLSPVQRDWLRALAPEQVIATDLRRDLMGPSHLQAGNGIATDWQRSRDTSLARTVHRRTGITGTPSQLARHARLDLKSTQDLIALLLGAAPAHAQSLPAPEPEQANKANSKANDKPGALSLPAEPTALLDTRYLWSPQGWLLHTQRQGAALGSRHAGHDPASIPPQAQVERQTQAYNLAGQLTASVRSTGTAERAEQETDVWRYAWQARSQQRVLAQEVQGPNPQSQTQQGTTASTFDAQGRLAGRYNANGQPEQLTAPDSQQGQQGQPSQRHYSWDALGRLTQVSQAGQPVASYAYDHRGLRTTKITAQSTGQTAGQSTAQTTSHTLYNESRQPLAELDAQGRITRQYLWLADMLLAVMDGQAKPAGAQTPDSNNTLNQSIPLTQDLWALLQSWGEAVAGNWHLAFIHSNHLGAPELATDLQGQIIWQASYAPFGAAKVSTAQSSFILNLRLPGQMFDPETGLHYNRQRYYDPQTGQYLTPDPLGQPDGPNAYLYVAGNPLAFVDPDGLILFAFDGTGNSDKIADPAMAGSSLSNVVRFRDLYRDSSTDPRYVSGVGTVHEDADYGNIVPDDYAKGKLLDYLTGSDPLYLNDMGGNYSGPARIDRMMLYMMLEADAEKDNNKALNIDIVGFSRGAAQARDFANKLTSSLVMKNGITYYRYLNEQDKFDCQAVNFRFMGLFDTVLSTNFSGTNYQLGIPSQFTYVAQAVALNEHRSSNILGYNQRAPLPHSQHWGGFPLESIGANSTTAGATRIEQGFLGSHADIGGGFKDNELSKVALAWMIEQATKAGVKMDTAPIAITASAVLHDKSNNIQTGKPDETCWLCTGGEDRTVNRTVSGDKQRNMGFGSGSNSMTYADTQAEREKFITYRDRSTLERYTLADVWDKERNTGIEGVTRSMVGEIKTAVTGTVDIEGYVAWLKLNGYDLNQLQVQK